MKTPQRIGFAATAILLAASPVVFALDYYDFPAELQSVLDEHLAELEEQGGVSIAGRVTFADGRKIFGGHDVMVNIHAGTDHAVRIHPGGWFVAEKVMKASAAGSGRRVTARAFEYESLDQRVKIRRNEITYLNLELKRLNPRLGGTIEGIVVNHDEVGVQGATVRLRFQGASSRDEPADAYETEQEGKFVFKGLPAGEYSLVASKRGMAYDRKLVSVERGKAQEVELYVSPPIEVSIDYVYQSDGSRGFTDGGIQTGTVSWTYGRHGLDFSDGKVEGYEPDDLRDLELRQKEDVLSFAIFYSKGGNGVYDAGDVPFADVTEARKHGYQSRNITVLEDHVYVVKTFEGHYAKLIVKEIRY